MNRDEGLASIFRSTKKTKWIVAAISMFMLSEGDMGQLYSGIISEKGIWGLWLLWVGLISTAIVPLVFAPMWVKLNLLTDNQFTLYRFSGSAAKTLHKFRAVYVGGIIVSFVLAFKTVAFGRILQVYYDISMPHAVLITGALLSLFALKNTYSSKFKTDILHGIIYIASLIIAFYFLYKNSGGYQNIIETIKLKSPDTLSIVPPKGNQDLWNTMFIYLGIQWWSSSTYDGGGPEMSRYTAAGSKWGAIKVGLFSKILLIPITLVVIFMALMSFVNTGFSANGEIGFIISIFESVPDYIAPVVLLGFFALFISSAEGTLNWGASFLAVDYYKGYLQTDKSENHYRIISFLSMLLLSITATIIAYYVDSLELLIKIMFSISAGVAPVFVLRWFWMRINAWSQLSAMLSSGVFTLLFFIFEYYNPNFFDSSGLFAYEWRMIVVTLLTTITWLIITFLTPKDSEEIINRFVKILPPKKEIIKLFIVAILIGLAFIVVQSGVIYLLFS